MIELPIYLLSLVFMAKSMGIRGVAIAWLLRVVIDSGLLFLFSWRLLPENNFVIKKLPTGCEARWLSLEQQSVYTACRQKSFLSALLAWW